ncbi:SDR family oxidoreductase [Candidatus Pelagibacter sp.]|nr:SDR family oxidoreductase [Candidatus Pelagibacter sp.]
MKKILVTGALGHIGSKLIKDLPKILKKTEITMIDNFVTQRFTSLFNLEKKNKYKFYELDVVFNKFKIEKIIKKIDIVIHLAAITDAANSFKNPKLVEKNNLLSTKIISNLCSKHKKKLIFISSTSVYGSQNETVDENCSKDELQPQSPYAITKLKEENLIKNLIKNKKLKSVICRFGTIYGYSPGMRFHTAVNKFCFQAVFQQDITIWKTAYNQKRPYLDINDAIKALAFIIKNNIFDGEVYNILTENLTVRQVIDTIKKNIKNTKIKYVNSQIMNQLSYKVLNTKFKNKGYTVSGNFKKSIEKTINILKNSNNSTKN